MNARLRQVIVITLASLFLLSAIPQKTYAFSFKVEGFLKDENGIPIPNANISISGDYYDYSVQNLVPRTFYRTTDNNGYYVIYVAASEPDGFIMETTLTASYLLDGEVVSSNTGKVLGLGVWMNLSYEEPSSPGDFFKTPAGILSVIILISVFIIGFFAMRTPKEEEIVEKEEKPPKVQRRRRR